MRLAADIFRALMLWLINQAQNQCRVRKPPDGQGGAYCGGISKGREYQTVEGTLAVPEDLSTSYLQG